MGPWGAFATTVGVMAPSAVLTLMVNRLSLSRSDTVWMRALREGLAPVVIALMLATAWILSESWWGEIGVLGLVAITAILTVATRIAPVVLIAGGAVIGGLGLLG